jgi:hypothetical protein
VKKLYGSQNSLIVGHLKHVLESHGIPCFIKNEYLAGAAGEIPPTESWPELWVVEDRDQRRALQILETAMVSADPLGEPWRCSSCGEESEGQFTACWNCGAARPDTDRS